MKKKVFVNPSVQMVECETAVTILAGSNISDGGADGRNSREMNPTPAAEDNFFLN
ncbi:MAG: hypothetical protein II463_01345 [Bacteroidaceae bacterium]|jgi:hypothetical protein|nr:hypothetical protein [Bacteroidaceae bacterium]MBO7346941.1 hypothetical protein [Bacteroidaceae bacterium]MBQ2073323.1 hypothetical protein [Bacteroidaceae bacterium]